MWDNVVSCIVMIFQSFFAVLMGLLVAENMDAILEVSRVFGNFSRFKDVRDILSSHKGIV